MAYPSSITPEIQEQLEAPFPKIKWRPQNIIKSKKDGKNYGIMMAFITAKDVIDRLNSVIGPENWSQTIEVINTGQNEYVQESKTYGNYNVPEKNITEETFAVKVSIQIFDSVKEDIGYPNSPESKDPLKSAVSDAIKRCAVQYGIGKFLYNIGNKFVEYDQYKKPVRHEDIEKLENMFQSVS